MNLFYDDHYSAEGFSLMKNALAMFAGQIVVPMVNFLLAIIVGRSLGVSNFGYYSVLIALIFMLQGIQILGLQQYIIKEIASNKSSLDKYVSNIALVGILLSIIFYAFICFYAGISKYPVEIIRASYVYALVLFSNLGSLILEALFIACEKIKYNTYAIIAGSIFSLVLSFIAVRLGFGLNAIMFILTIAGYVSFFIGFYFFTKYVSKIKFVLDLSLIKTLLSSAKIFSAIMIVNSIWITADILILSRISSINSVGFYSVAKKFSALVIILPYSIIMPLLPILSKHYYKSFEFFEEFFEKALAVIVVSILPLIVLMVFLTDKLIFFVYGGEFAKAGFPMRVMLFSAIPLSMSFTTAKVLLVAGKQKYDLIAFGIGVAVFILLGTAVSGRYEAAGMAVSYSATCVILCVLHYYFARRYVFKKDIFLPIVRKAAFPAIAMGGIIYVLKGLNYIAVSFFSIIVYFAIIWLMKIFTKEDVTLFYDMLTTFIYPPKRSRRIRG